MKTWWRIRKEYRKLKKQGFLFSFTKKELKTIAELNVRCQEYIII